MKDSSPGHSVKPRPIKFTVENFDQKKKDIKSQYCIEKRKCELKYIFHLNQHRPKEGSILIQRATKIPKEMFSTRKT